MAKCDYCGKEVVFPFSCGYCGNKYCDEHRLPENHNCSNRPQEAPAYINPSFTRGDQKANAVEPKIDLIETSQIQQTKERRHFPIRKIVGVALAIMIIVPFIIYAGPIVSFITTHLPFQGQNNETSETFQLVQSSILVPVMITRHFELQKGNHLIGTFIFTALPNSNYQIAVAILDPLDGTLQVFDNRTTGSFDITASISGAYTMNFGFTCSNVVVITPSVTLNTTITH